MIYIVIYLFLEVMISTALASAFGGLLTFMEIVLTAIIGTTMLRNFKQTLTYNMKDLTSGNISQEEFIKLNVAKAIGAALLIVPGYFTDILGIALQFGLLTMALTKIFSLKPKMPTNEYKNVNNNFYYETQFKQNPKTNTRNDDEIIDVEIIDDDKHLKH